MHVNYASYFKIILDACSGLTLCNRYSVPIICWPTYCCMAIRRFWVVTSTVPELHTSEKRQPIDKKQTLMWECVRPVFSVVCHWHVIIIHDSHESQEFNLANSKSFPSHFLPVSSVRALHHSLYSH